MFPSLSIGTPGPYTLKASSPAASNTPESDEFNVANNVATCDGTGCSFTDTQALNSYKTKPQQGTAGATWASTLNLPGLKVSCDFAPFDYPDARQPNAVWYVYDDGATGSAKINAIFIDKAFVQETPDNGTSKYRVCYSSPIRSRIERGNWAQPDPWSNGPSAYFGGTWFTDLLPDCSTKNPVAPCVLKLDGHGGNRIGTFLTPAGRSELPLGERAPASRSRPRSHRPELRPGRCPCVARRRAGPLRPGRRLTSDEGLRGVRDRERRGVRDCASSARRRSPSTRSATRSGGSPPSSSRTSRVRPPSASGSTRSRCARSSPATSTRCASSTSRTAARSRRSSATRSSRSSGSEARAWTTRSGRSRLRPRAWRSSPTSTTSSNGRGASDSWSGPASAPATSSSARRWPVSTS